MSRAHTFMKETLEHRAQQIPHTHMHTGGTADPTATCAAAAAAAPATTLACPGRHDTLHAQRVARVACTALGMLCMRGT